MNLSKLFFLLLIGTINAQEITTEPTIEEQEERLREAEERMKAFFEEREKQNSVDTLEALINQPDALSADLAMQLLKNCPDRIRTIIARLQRAQKLASENVLLEDDIIKDALITDKLLLIGPPGVGKSDLAKAIARALNRPFIFIQSSLIATEYQNSGAQNLRRIINQVRETSVPYVLIFDEIHSIIDKKKNEQKSDQDSAVALWQLLDECSLNKNILFIGTTNNKNNIPEALKSRFSTSIVCIDLPNEQLRRNIFNYYVGNYVSPELLSYMVKKTANYCAREIKEIAREMIAHCIEHERNQLNQEDFVSALNHTKAVQAMLEPSWKEQSQEFIKNHGFATVGCLTGLASLTLQLLQWSQTSSSRPATVSV